MIALADGQKAKLPLGPLQKLIITKLIKGTDIEEMLKEFKIM